MNSFWSFVIRRFIGILPLLFIILTTTFFLIRSAPGNPFANERVFSPKVIEHLNKQYGLDRPVFFFSVKREQTGKLFFLQFSVKWNGSNNQYWNYIKTILLDFDLGPSTRYTDLNVNKIISKGLPVSALIGVVAYVIALILGIIGGVLAALKSNSICDYLSNSISIIGVSVPGFVLGPVLVILFSLTFHWLPPARWGTISHFVLPVLTLSMVYLSYIFKLTRVGMLDVLGADYVCVARAKGLSEFTVIWRHCLRGGLLPVISFTGPAIAFLLGGAIVVEKIFAIPGLGNFFIEAANARDYTVVMGIVLVTSVILIVANFLVDLVYALIDQRVLTGNR